MNWDDLPPKERKGSRPRCLRLTDEADGRASVAGRLTELIAPHGIVTAEDWWSPRGLVDHREVMLHEAERLLTAEQRRALQDWWLASPRSPRTPVWDLASSVSIDGRRGLLLVEAKAHVSEFALDGKDGPNARSGGSVANHERIAEAIVQASAALTKILGRTVTLNRDSHYQLANRFAWSWRLATMGVPVILLYLGFCGATEWSDGFADQEAWARTVHQYGVHLDPAIWGQPIDIGGTPFIPLICTTCIDLPAATRPPGPTPSLH
jgi:hypothetical protein